MDKNAMVRLAEIEVDPSQLAAYTAFLVEEIEASLRLEPGVLFLQAVAERDNPARIRVFEAYASPEAYQSHIASAHFLTYKTGTAAMVKSLKLTELSPLALAARAGAFGPAGQG